MTYRLAVVGGGNMGTALVRGLLEAQWAGPDELLVVEVLPERRSVLADELPGVEIVGSLEGLLIDGALAGREAR